MPEQSPTRFTMVPARRSSEPTARRRARRILIALFLAAALSIVAVFVALTSGSSKPDLSAVTPQGRDLSYTAAMNFLAGRVQDVPRADSFDPQAASVEAPDGTSAPLDYRALNWVGFTPRHFGTKELGFTDFEIHHYLVVLNDQAATQSPSPAAAAGRARPRPEELPRPRPAGPRRHRPAERPRPRQVRLRRRARPVRRLRARRPARRAAPRPVPARRRR
ncbi:hypothetical protein ACFQY7_49750 [Actinomadura luteofluorescens]|uniref:hypothetical protein n=1 Tax=Actinomadura luteofluorescens TaxID=46163 RepID=UPI00362F2617